MTSCDKSCGCGPEPATTEAATAPSNEGTWVSSFSVPKMDCPSEERMIRLALNGFPELNSLSFDLSSRELRDFHDGPVDQIATKLNSEERRVGTGCVRTGRYRWWSYPSRTKKKM